MVSDLFRHLRRAVRHVIESAKLFVRWMHGTCVECDPVLINEDEEYIFNYYELDIAQNPYVVKLNFTLNMALSRTFEPVIKTLNFTFTDLR